MKDKPQQIRTFIYFSFSFTSNQQTNFALCSNPEYKRPGHCGKIVFVPPVTDTLWHNSSHHSLTHYTEESPNSKEKPGNISLKDFSSIVRKRRLSGLMNYTDFRSVSLEQAFILTTTGSAFKRNHLSAETYVQSKRLSVLLVSRMGRRNGRKPYNVEW